MRLLAFLVAAGVILGGCATPPADPASAGDPYEATNRVIFDLNLKIDSVTLKPTAERYQNYVPEEVRESLRYALDNLHAPVVFANDLGGAIELDLLSIDLSGASGSPMYTFEVFSKGTVSGQSPTSEVPEPGTLVLLAAAVAAVLAWRRRKK